MMSTLIKPERGILLCQHLHPLMKALEKKKKKKKHQEVYKAKPSWGSATMSHQQHLLCCQSSETDSAIIRPQSLPELICHDHNIIHKWVKAVSLAFIPSLGSVIVVIVCTFFQFISKCTMKNRWHTLEFNPEYTVLGCWIKTVGVSGETEENRS